MVLVEVLEAKVIFGLCGQIVVCIQPAHLLHAIVREGERCITAHLVGVTVVGGVLHDAGVTVVAVGSIRIHDFPDNLLGGRGARGLVERSHEVRIQCIEVGLGDDVVDVGLGFAELAHIEEHAGEQGLGSVFVGPHTLVVVTGVVFLGQHGDGILEVLHDVVVNFLDSGQFAVLEDVRILFEVAVHYDVLAVVGPVAVVRRAPGAGQVPVSEGAHEEEFTFASTYQGLVCIGHIRERIGSVGLGRLQKLECGVAGGGHVVQIFKATFEFL